MNNQLKIRAIKPSDNLNVANVIRTVLTEFGCVGEGYSIEDPEIDAMYDAYVGDKACFYVIVDESDQPLGGGGVAPLTGGDGTVCEIQKMYFLEAARGQGMGRRLLEFLIEESARLGFQRVYLETTERMETANVLYRKFGFLPLESNLGCTGHSACDTFYVKDI